MKGIRAVTCTETGAGTSMESVRINLVRRPGNYSLAGCGRCSLEYGRAGI